MFMDVVTKLFGSKHSRDLKRIQPMVDSINAHYEDLQALSDDELRGKTAEFQNRIQEVTKEIVAEAKELEAQLRADSSEQDDAVHDKENHADELRDQLNVLYEQELELIKETLDEILPEAFAVVKDACRRLVGQKVFFVGQQAEWDMIPYDVQLVGGIVLHEGKISEMATGEGKTLVATLPLYLNALPGKGAHLVTVNDYLARRDCEWMGHVYNFLGLKSAYIINDMTNEERREAYNADITYGTNNEFGFDYLRDNMAVYLNDKVQRNHHFAIVDEVDSVLVDEARTPLIIAGPVESSIEQYNQVKPRVEALVRRQSMLISRKVAEAEALFKDEKYDEAGVLLLQASRGAPKHKKLIKFLNEVGVKKLVRRVESDYIRDKRMPEIDEELYYAIDEKGHTIDPTDKGREALAPNDPEMFVLPDMSEAIHKIDSNEDMTPEEKQLEKDKVHTNYATKADALHSIQQLLRAFSLYEKDVEYVIADGKVVIVDEFTGRLMAGRRFSDGLHQALEAKEGVEVRGETQTMATITLQNYFRMYAKLAGMTGTAETEASEFWEIYKLDVVVIPTNRPITRIDSEDSVYKTRREKYNAVINEIEKLHQKKQPVLVGTITVDVSETLSRMLKRRGIPHSVLNAKNHHRESEIVAKAGEPGRVTIATNMAGRGTDIKLGAGVKDVGGLHILGTERHESRRIDRQLRGRSGRQGDPGSTQFFLSLEDDLMRLFSPDRIISVMDRLGLEEGEVIQHSMVTKSIERAQKKVEGHNFSIRKHLLEYDDVMNQQREVIYDRRNHALRGENLKDEILEMIADRMSELANTYANDEEFASQYDLDALKVEFQRSFLSDWPLSEDDERSLSSEEISEKLTEAAIQTYNRKEAALGSEHMRELERRALLEKIDTKWKDHLYEMDQLKEGINLRAYGQKDPLLEYKSEGFRMFKDLLGALNVEVLEFAFKAQLVHHVPADARVRKQRQRMVEQHQSAEGMGFSGRVESPAEQQAGKSKPVVVEKTGRNEPCPCGSGKKYKKCHGRESS